MEWFFHVHFTWFQTPWLFVLDARSLIAFCLRQAAWVAFKRALEHNMGRARLFREGQNDVPSPLSCRSRGHFGKSDYGRHVGLPPLYLTKYIHFPVSVRETGSLAFCLCVGPSSRFMHLGDPFPYGDHDSCLTSIYCHLKKRGRLGYHS